MKNEIFCLLLILPKGVALLHPRVSQGSKPFRSSPKAELIALPGRLGYHLSL